MCMYWLLIVIVISKNYLHCAVKQKHEHAQRSFEKLAHELIAQGDKFRIWIWNLWDTFKCTQAKQSKKLLCVVIEFGSYLAKTRKTGQKNMLIVWTWSTWVKCEKTMVEVVWSNPWQWLCSLHGLKYVAFLFVFGISGWFSHSNHLTNP